MKCPKCGNQMVLQEVERGNNELCWWCMWCGCRQPMLHNDIICTVDNQVVAVQRIDGWTLIEINEFMAIQQEYYPERDYRIKRS